MDGVYDFACPTTSLGWVLESSVHGSIKSTSTSYVYDYISFY